MVTSNIGLYSPDLNGLIALSESILGEDTLPSTEAVPEQPPLQADHHVEAAAAAGAVLPPFLHDPLALPPGGMLSDEAIPSIEAIFGQTFHPVGLLQTAAAAAPAPGAAPQPLPTDATPQSTRADVPPPICKRRAEDQHPAALACKRNLTELFVAAQYEKPAQIGEDLIRKIMDAIPFDTFKPLVSEERVPVLERMIRSCLPLFLKTTPREVCGAKYTAADPLLKSCRIRCDGDAASDEFEIYIRFPAAEGSTKVIYQQIFLSGPQRGKVFAYAKPQKDERYTANCTELFREISISKVVQPSEHLVKIEEVWRRKRPSQVKGIRMPWCDGGDVVAYCKRPFSEANHRERLLIFRDIALGLKELHSHNLCHNDLKSLNILLQKREQGLRALISDFGRVYLTDTRFRCPISTRAYLAPEQIAEEQPIAPSADLWSMGLILLELMHGTAANLFLNPAKRLFKEVAFNTPEMFLDIRLQWVVVHDEIMQSLDKSSPVDQLITRLLSLDPRKRPLAHQIVEEVERLIEGSPVPARR